MPGRSAPPRIRTLGGGALVLAPQDVVHVLDVVRDRTGLALSAHAPVVDRVTTVAAHLGLAPVELVARARRRPFGDEARWIVDALTTNDTAFFRDPELFSIVAERVLPRLAAGGPRTIWAAAAASGQEAYSLAMLARETLPSLAVRVLATDVSSAMVHRIRSGVYVAGELEGLSPTRLARYFEPSARDGSRRIELSLRSTVEAQELSLLDAWPRMETSLVWMTHVLDALERPAQASILERVSELLPDDGALVLGAHEAPAGLDAFFVAETRGLYRVRRGRG